MFVLVFVCCAVICKYRSCDWLTSRPNSPAKCRKQRFETSTTRGALGSPRNVEPREKTEYTK